MIARVLLFLLWPTLLQAQGFAGLGTDAEGFSTPQPGYVFDFPADHGPHPDFRIEWWYVTSNLKGADGAEYGVQWTLFRSALAPEEAEGWRSPQIWFAHAGLTAPDQHFAAERVARGGIGQAGVRTVPFSAWIDDWELAGPDFDRLTMTARGAEFAYALDLRAAGPLVFHGQDGFSVKSREGQASYYYSQPHFEVSGVLTLPEGPVEVSGTAWLDREWSSQPLSEGQSGWDWFSLNFDDGAKLMGFRLRQVDGAHYTSATWIGANGAVQAYADGALQTTPLDWQTVAGRKMPTRWQVTLPERGLDLTVEALNAQAWMDLSIAYWEGPVRVTGSHSGRGYLEMTGYAPE